MRRKRARNQLRGMDVIELKRSQLEHIARHREELRKSPHLRWLFLKSQTAVILIAYIAEVAVLLMDSL